MTATALASINWLHDLAYFFGGAFLANAVPHYVSGVMGRSRRGRCG
jgi:hypothetical protein